MKPLVGTKLAYAGAVLSGVLYWASFAGIDAWPFTFVAFGPLWIALRGQTPKRAFALGTLAGTTMNVLGFYWLLDMLAIVQRVPQGGVRLLPPRRLRVPGDAGGARWVGSTRAPARADGRRYRSSWRRSSRASSSTRSSSPGTSRRPSTRSPPSRRWPSSAGRSSWGSSSSPRTSPSSSLSSRASSDGASTCASSSAARSPRRATLVYGGVRIPKVDAEVAAAEPVKVGVVQGNMGLMQKREDPAEGLRRHLKKTGELKQRGVDFVVWSESSVTFPMREDMTRPDPPP